MSSFPDVATNRRHEIKHAALRGRSRRVGRVGRPHGPARWPQAEVTVPSSATTRQQVERMLDEIHRHYKQQITLSILAKVLGRQSAEVGRLFRDEIGVTVHEYV